jgi:hypothetical protein
MYQRTWPKHRSYVMVRYIRQNSNTPRPIRSIQRCTRTEMSPGYQHRPRDCHSCAQEERIRQYCCKKRHPPSSQRYKRTQMTPRYYCKRHEGRRYAAETHIHRHPSRWRRCRCTRCCSCRQTSQTNPHTEPAHHTALRLLHMRWLCLCTAEGGSRSCRNQRPGS